VQLGLPSQDISTNTLLSQIVKEHLKWHANTSNAGFTAVTRLLITNLISHLSEQEIISLAENVAKYTNKDTILLLENKYISNQNHHTTRLFSLQRYAYRK
jgi:hypothetical protein